MLDRRFRDFPNIVATKKLKMECRNNTSKSLSQCIQTEKINQTPATLRLLLVCILFKAAAPNLAQAAQPVEFQTRAQGNKYLVVTANPYASKAGARILAEGGTAVDAAIAVQLVLTLVEPQSSGIGGGAFILHWHKSSKLLETFDGRETAPSAANPDRFYRNGHLMSHRQARLSALSIGVPGIVRLLEHVHQKHGRLSWARLFEPAIKLAEKGFRVSPRLSGLLNRAGKSSFSRAGQTYFFRPGGSAVPVGYRLKNPRYAVTLRKIAAKGSQAFYEGRIARQILNAVHSAKGSQGDMSHTDLKNYKVIERTPVCIRYRGHRICGMGPPSSGALAIGQTLKLIEPFKFDAHSIRANPAPFMHLVSEAQRLAFADRARYVSDPAFQHVPVRELLAERYLRERRSLLSLSRPMQKVSPGRLKPPRRGAYGIDHTIESSGTSHLSVLDKYGNGVSMTTTIESAFGSRIMAAGFLLNNELTDFSLRWKDRFGRTITNRVQGEKRPRSSMSPTMIFDHNGRLVALLGSPGGEKIILYVTKLIIGLLDYGLNAQQAVELANFGNTGKRFLLESNRTTRRAIRELRRLGHEIRLRRMTSGSHVITNFEGDLRAGVDPRREGLALGRGFRQ